MSNIMIIGTQAKELAELWEAAEGELTPEVEAAYQKLMQSGEAGVAILADVRDELTARAAQRKAKAKELMELAKKDEQMVENNQKYMLLIMERMGVKKVQVGGLVVTRSEGRESVNVLDADAVPDSYKRATITIPGDQLYLIEGMFPDAEITKAIDKTAIKQVYKDSEGKIGVAGTEIIRTPYLTIKG